MDYWTYLLEVKFWIVFIDEAFDSLGRRTSAVFQGQDSFFHQLKVGLFSSSCHFLDQLLFFETHETSPTRPNWIRKNG